MQDSILNTIQGRERVSNPPGSEKQTESREHPEPNHRSSEEDCHGIPGEASTSPEEHNACRSTGLISGRLEEHVGSEENTSTDIAHLAEEVREESP